MRNKKKQEQNIFSEIFKGDFLSKKENQEQLPFILFVVTLIIFNITLYYNAEQLARNINKAEKDYNAITINYRCK